MMEQIHCGQFMRGFRHGFFGFYSPGLIYGEDEKEYMRGYKEGICKRELTDFKIK